MVKARPPTKDPPTTPRAAPAHTQHEDQPWTVRIPDHPRRSESALYRRTRKTMNEKAKSIAAFFYGGKTYDDHHGGGLWLKDGDGWFLIRNLAGIEWSAQFCADPAKVDQLRRNARRIYARFPEAVEELGIRELLDTPIQTADDVARWTDSICNASVPLPSAFHTGVLPQAGGLHHYPTPVAEIALFKYDDFQLWQTDKQGRPVAVVPVGPRGSGDGRTALLFAGPGSPLARKQATAAHERQAVFFAADHEVSTRAFRQQYAKLSRGRVAPGDPLARLTEGPPTGQAHLRRASTRAGEP